MKKRIPHMKEQDFYQLEKTAHPHAEIFSVLVEIGGGSWGGAEFRNQTCAIAGLNVNAPIGVNDRPAWQEKMNLLIDVWNSFTVLPTAANFEAALRLRMGAR